MFQAIWSLMILTVPFANDGFSAEPDKLAQEKMAGVKTNVGHYVAIDGRGDLEELACLDEPAVRGVNIRYSWAKLEPEKDQYDFTSIRKDLDTVAAHNKQLVVFLTDKSFGPGGKPLPKYMKDYALPGKKGGVSPKRWDPEFVDRIVALVRALGKEFDSHPNLEGIAFQESAPSLTADVLEKTDYTPEKYRDALKTMLIESSKAMPHTRIFWYQNFLPGNNEYLLEIADALLPYPVAFGGPDILPYRISLIERAPTYQRYEGKLVLFCSAQPDSYRHHKDDTSMEIVEGYRRGEKPIHKDGYVPMEEIFEYGRDVLHLNYIFWSYIEKPSKSFPGDPTSSDFQDALRVIRKNPTFN